MGEVGDSQELVDLTRTQLPSGTLWSFPLGRVPIA